MFRPPFEPSERISKVSILNAAILVAFYSGVGSHKLAIESYVYLILLKYISTYVYLSL